MTPWEEENQRKEAEKAVKLQWLRSLRPGHKVAVRNSGSANGYEIYEVARITPTQIVVNYNSAVEYRYSKKDGKRIGGRSSWHFPRGIEPVKPKIMEMVELSNLRQWFANLADDNRRLSLTTLRALKAAVKPIIAADGGNDAA